MRDVLLHERGDERLGTAVRVEAPHGQSLEHAGRGARTLIGAARDAWRKRRHVDVVADGTGEERRQLGAGQPWQAAYFEVGSVFGVRHEERAAPRDRAEPVGECGPRPGRHPLQDLAGEDGVVRLEAGHVGERGNGPVLHPQTREPTAALEPADDFLGALERDRSVIDDEEVGVERLGEDREVEAAAVLLGQTGDEQPRGAPWGRVSSCARGLMNALLATYSYAVPTPSPSANAKG